MTEEELQQMKKETAELLIKHGADVNKTDTKGTEARDEVAKSNKQVKPAVVKVGKNDLDR